MRVLQIVKTNEGAAWAFAQSQWLFHHGVDIITVLPFVEGGMAEKYIANGMRIGRPYHFNRCRGGDIVIDKVTGYTVKPKSPVQLANAIVKMLENPAAAMKTAGCGQSKVKDMLDIHCTGNKVLSVYSDILKVSKHTI